MLSRLQPSKRVAMPLAGALSLGAIGALIAYKFGLYGSTCTPEGPSSKVCLKGFVAHIGKSEKNPLTKEEMFRRKQQILDINYYLVLNLLQGEYYEGFVNITFHLKHAVTTQLFLDFVYGEGVYSVEVNGKDITKRPDVYRNQRIGLPEELLRMGENKVVVNFLKKYAKDGAGLHSVDDAEGFQYIYSQCESTYCCRIFPCFDQPNLKATLEFHSITPKEWTVVSNEPIARLDICHKTIYDKYRLRNQRNEEEETIFAIFNITQRISTYLYAFIAGPYVSPFNSF